MRVRFTMIRMPVRTAALMAAMLAIPAIAFTAPAPALASGGGTKCESSGDPWCIGSADLQLDTAVAERMPGRNIIEQPLGTTYDGLHTFLLEFSADASKCVAAANWPSLNVKIHPCSGGSGVVWAQDESINGEVEWINRLASQNNGAVPGMDETEILYLAGHNNGTNFVLAEKNASSTEFFNFSCCNEQSGIARRGHGN